MEESNVYGLDIAKTVFHVCRMNRGGRVIERKRLQRSEVLEYFSTQARGLVGIESCGGSSYWARELEGLGFEVRLIPAQYVKPFVKSQKNDTIDAEAIAEAVVRPTMRFVSANTIEQQDIQNVHRVRERLVKQRTALSNQIRGLLLEYGIVVAKGVAHVRAKLVQLFDEPMPRLLFREIFADLKDELLSLEEKIKRYDSILKRISRENKACQALEQISGVGPTTSTAILAAVRHPKDFKNGRQFSAWLGLVPRQHSTGGKQKLGSITKCGNKYIRKLLVHGARMEIRYAKKHDHTWLIKLNERRGYNRAAVALANKNARRLWATLSKFQSEPLAA